MRPEPTRYDINDLPRPITIHDGRGNEVEYMLVAAGRKFGACLQKEKPQSSDQRDRKRD